MRALMSARLDGMTPAKNEWARDASNECVNCQFPTSNFQSTLGRSTLSSLGVGEYLDSACTVLQSADEARGRACDGLSRIAGDVTSRGSPRITADLRGSWDAGERAHLRSASGRARALRGCGWEPGTGTSRRSEAVRFVPVPGSHPRHAGWQPACTTAGDP